MNHRLQFIHIIGCMLILLLVAACSTSQPAPTPTLPARTSTSVVKPAPSETAAESVIEWDYVAMGDSRTGHAQWPAAYADYLEAALGIKVNLYNRAGGGQDSNQLLSDLREKEELRAQVREAEVVTVWTGGIRSKSAITYKAVPCDDALDAMGTDLDDIIAEILALRAGNDTLIRLFEDYHFQVEPQKELGFFQDKRACVQGLIALVHQTGSKYGIPVVPVYEAFNGPDGDQDPNAYLQDKVHTNAIGDSIIADLLREMGYE